MAHHAAAGGLMQFNEILLRAVRRLTVGCLFLVTLFVIKVSGGDRGIAPLSVPNYGPRYLALVQRGKCVVDLV